MSIDGYPAKAFDNFIVVTSGTRPALPWAGMMIFETDTGRVFIWNGSTWKIMIPELEGFSLTSPILGPAAGATATLATFSLSKNYSGLPVNIMLTANGWVLDTLSSAGVIDHSVWLEVSVNNGSSWVVGKAQTDSTYAGNAKFRGTFMVSLMYVATPTNTVQVRLRASQQGGSAAVKNYYDSVINAQVVGV